MTKFNRSYVGLRDDLLKYIKGGNLDVLDVGCATGVNGSFLLDNDMIKSVDGVEFDEEMADIAKKKYDNVFVGDLNSSKFLSLITNENNGYDYILFGDILEHLINPLDVLLEFKNVLKPDGKIIISVPNIAHLELFIQVYIKGTWPKNERGIFDKTHLSWFTKKDIHLLLKKAGLHTLTYERKFRGRDANTKFNFITKIIKLINKDWVTFQHIIVCKHDR